MSRLLTSLSSYRSVQVTFYGEGTDDVSLFDLLSILMVVVVGVAERVYRRPIRRKSPNDSY